MESVKIRWPEGNTLPLCVKLRQIVVVEGGSNYGDYIPPAGSVVTAQLVNGFKTIDYEVTLDGNKVYFTDNGTLSAGEYGIVINVTEPDRKLRSFKYGQLVIIREADNLKLGDYLVDNAVTLTADAFIFGKGDPGVSPHIDEVSGNWFIGNQDTGVHAQGEPGTTDYNELEHKPDLSIYQQKEEGKGLSSNDFSDGEKEKLNNTYTKTEVDNKVGDINEKIPAAASAQNQLADKSFVNSSVATATATYRGAYNLVSDLGLTTSATEQQIAAALATKMAALGITPDNNDYCFVQVPTADATPTQIERVDRYKFNGTAWLLEFSLNNSGFTAAQWAALNSGITTGLVTKLIDLPTNSELTTLLNGKQAVISDLDTIRSGAAAGATAYQKPLTGIPAQDIALGVIPDVSNFITKSVDDLVNYYLKSETYTKTEVQTLIDAVKQFTYEVVQTLPTATADTMHKIYLVPSADPQTQNVKDEYITIDNGTEAQTRYTWEQIGSTAIDLSGYVTTTALNTALADYTTTAALTLLLAGKQDVINDLSDIRSGASAGATAYQKPQGGIPSTDMSSAVQTSLGKADSSLQPTQQTLTNEQKQTARNNIGAAGVDDVPTLPNNVSYFSNDSGDGIVPTDGIRGVDIVASSAISVNPDVVTAITGEIGSATTITLVVPNDSLRHVWDMFFTTASNGGATIVVPQGATLHVPSGYSIASGKTYEVRVIGVGSHYYLSYGEYN